MTQYEDPDARRESSRAAAVAWAGLATAFTARTYLAFIVALGMLASIPVAFGLSAFVITGGSMRPLIGAGDVVMSLPFSASEPVPMGRVVEFLAAQGSATTGPVMHRVVAINKDGTLVTAGDANTQFDTAPLQRADIVGVAVVLVKWAGLPAYWLAHRDLVSLAVWLILTGLAVAVEVLGLRCHRRRPAHAVVLPASALVIAIATALGGPGAPGASAAFTAQEMSQGNSWTYPAAKAVARLSFSTSPGSSTGGKTFARQPVVTLLDAGGVPTTGKRAITLTLAGGTGGALACTANPVTTSHGTAVFAGCSVDKVGKYTLVASATSLPTASSASFMITTGPAARLHFSASPGTTALAAQFAVQPAVRVLDAGGNLTASTAPVTLTLTTAAGATLTCSANPKAAVGGTATFSGCSVNKGGTYTFTARATGVTDAVSASFVVNPAPLLTCNSTIWMATFSWTPTPNAATTYTLYVNGIKVPATGADGWNSNVQLTSNNVPASRFAAGTATVEVRRLPSAGGEQVVGTGKVVLGAAGYRTYLCG